MRGVARGNVPAGRGARVRRSRARQRLVGLGLAGAVALAGCAGPRIVPLPAPTVQVDTAHGTITVAEAGVELAVRPSAWRGSPWDLPGYVTPFLVRLSNGAAVPVSYEHAGVRLFDDARFQYTALPPEEVERILRSRGGEDLRLAAAGSPPPVRRRVLRDPFWDWWWWDRYGPPWYYPPPSLEDLYLMALPMGVLQPGARLEGFVYFPRLRAEARRLTFEFHYRLGETPRVLILPFGVERSRRSGLFGG
jgi:hypothetical protein